MGCVPRDLVHVNEGGAVINNEGKVYPVLHQYDRLPELPKRFQAVQEIGIQQDS
jgi:hypothetical protein